MTNKNNTNVTEKPSRYLNYKFFAGLILLLTPLAYLVGASYYQGRLEAYGIDSIMFQPSIQNIYIYSFSAVGLLFLETFSFALNLLRISFSSGLGLLALISICTVAVGAYLKLRSLNNIKKKKFKRTKKIKKTLKRSNFFKGLIVTLFGIYIFYTTLIVVIAIAQVWWVAPISALNIGYASGLKTRDEFDNNVCCIQVRNKFSKCKTIINKDGTEYIKGILVTSSDRYLAFYTEEGSSVFEMPEGASLQSVPLPKSCPL